MIKDDRGEVYSWKEIQEIKKVDAKKGIALEKCFPLGDCVRVDPKGREYVTDWVGEKYYLDEIDADNCDDEDE